MHASRRSLAALVVACTTSAAHAEPPTPTSGTVPVTIQSWSKTTPLQIGTFLGGMHVAGVDRHGNASLYADNCSTLCETTPCTIYLPPGKAQLCTADGDASTVAPHHSANIDVPPTGADVWLRPSARSKPYFAGFFFNVAGAILIGVGTGALGSWKSGLYHSHRMLLTGEITAGVGGGLLAAGIPLMLVSAQEGVAKMKAKPTLRVGPFGASGTF